MSTDVQIFHPMMSLNARELTPAAPGGRMKGMDQNEPPLARKRDYLRIIAWFLVAYVLSLAVFGPSYPKEWGPALTVIYAPLLFLIWLMIGSS